MDFRKIINAIVERLEMDFAKVTRDRCCRKSTRDPRIKYELF